MLVLEAFEQHWKELQEKVRQQQAKIVLWEDIKHTPPKKLKVLPLAMIPHNFRLFRAILDLSFSIQMANGNEVPSVNKSSVKTRPTGAIDKMGHSLMRLTHVFTQAAQEEKISMAK